MIDHQQPDVMAHGMLTMAYLGRVLTHWVPQTRIRSFSARFVRMTQLGDVVQCSGQGVAVLGHPGEALITC